MNKKSTKDVQIEKMLNLYQKYKTFKKVSDLVTKKTLPPLTLDQQIESINPYYIRNEAIKYE